MARPIAALVEEITMPNTASFSTFVRPPGSPIYTAAGPALVLPRRAPAGRSQRTPSDEREFTVPDVRRQLSQVLEMIRAAADVHPPMPRIDPQHEELARSLQQLEQQLAERENAVEGREYLARERERDLAEEAALLQHREALVAATRKTLVTRPSLSAEERVALANLKTELNRQEAQLREDREALRQREKFVEESEKRLFEKVQEQQEKESELEQREEELKAREPVAETTSGAAAPVVKREFDEFRE